MAIINIVLAAIGDFLLKLINQRQQQTQQAQLGADRVFEETTKKAAENAQTRVNIDVSAATDDELDNSMRPPSARKD